MLTVSPALSARFLPLEMTDVFVVHVDVDEAPELAFVGVEVLAEIAVAPDERLEVSPTVPTVHFDDIQLAGKRPERCRNQNSMSHVMFLPCRDRVRSSADAGVEVVPASPRQMETVTSLCIAAARPPCSGVDAGMPRSRQARSADLDSRRQTRGTVSAAVL